MFAMMVVLAAVSVYVILVYLYRMQKGEPIVVDMGTMVISILVQMGWLAAALVAIFCWL